MLLQDVADTSTKVAATTKRLEKIAHLVDLLRRLQPPEIPIAVSYLSGYLRQGRIGIGWSSLRDAQPDHAAHSASLTLIEVDVAFDRLAGISGAGSTRERARLLHELLSRATSVEQAFLGKLVFGELRQGALEGIMLDAIARASQVPMPAVRRAHLMAGDLVAVATAALTSGEVGLSAFGVELFRPLQPMLADTAEGIDDALERLGQGAFEY